MNTDDARTARTMDRSGLTPTRVSYIRVRAPNDINGNSRVLYLVIDPWYIEALEAGPAGIDALHERYPRDRHTFDEIECLEVPVTEWKRILHAHGQRTLRSPAR